MGNGGSQKVTGEVAQREVLRLSWRIACNDLVHKVAHMESKIERAGSASKSGSFNTLNEAKGKTLEESRNASGTLKPQTPRSNLQNFQYEFMQQFFRYCPDLKSQFPTDFILIAKMIKSFLSELVKGSAKDVKTMAKKFAKGHRKYDLTREHFDGFGSALVKTIQQRLGKFGTLQLIGIWKTVVANLMNELHFAHQAERKRM
mmetsp:Transcript_21326/g.31739  ORF Transcript_21326/g.31739 Transcript_21326/m.31739 type:complete len:202 (+) Transcript_21326:68-673(+)|eukprot:CAMPEP_0167756700 /NCGR_PEP_ID=MMETSP0110_2-20121227/9529_1 /TAXON_ID=629695 /ORGANISM="Gymnochlora sp., Strain CCMP2014" /LENGTH=201 /DNA_ID=CAMNT_0007642835 /DNA_START=46 /DNA_END=651 /DNA_ORIENTATION=-